MEKKKTISEIENTFDKLITSLEEMNNSSIFKEEHKDINDILNTIIKWNKEFQTKKTLAFIKKEELLDIYNRIEKIKDKYIYDVSLGDDEELSDEASIWMWELMLLRKKQIERF